MIQFVYTLRFFLIQNVNDKIYFYWIKLQRGSHFKCCIFKFFIFLFLLAGVNCEQCLEGYYRPNGVSRFDSKPCVPCSCTTPGICTVGFNPIVHYIKLINSEVFILSSLFFSELPVYVYVCTLDTNTNSIEVQWVPINKGIQWR